MRQFSTRLHAAFVDLNRHNRRQNRNEVEEACVKDLFIEGLRDDYLKLNLKQHSMSNPQVSFHDLRKTVLRSRPEDSQNNERASNNMVHRQQALQTAPENSIHVVNMMKEFFNRQELREEALATSLRETLNQVSSLTKTVELQQKQREVERHNRQSGADSGDVSGNRQRRRCFACRELGHFAAACRRSHRYQHYQRDSPQSSSSQRQQQQRRAADNQYPDCFHRHEHQWSRDGRYGQSS